MTLRPALLALLLALPAFGAPARPKKKAAKPKPAPARPIKAKTLVLKKSPVKPIKAAATRGSEVAAPQPPKQLLEVPKPPLKPVVIPDRGRATTSARAVVAPFIAAPAKKTEARTAGNSVRAIPPAANFAPKATKTALSSAANPDTAATQGGARTPRRADAGARTAGLLPSTSGSGRGRGRGNGGFFDAAPSSPSLGQAVANGSRAARAGRSAAAAANGGGGGGGGGGGSGARRSGGGGGRPPANRGGGGAPGGAGAATAAKPAARAMPVSYAAATPPAPPAPPALPMVEASGIKRLARPASPEPSVSTIAVAGRKAYIHEGAVWLAKADGRPAPALLVDGVWRLYEVKDGSVLLRPAFPGLFAGRPDDPNLLLIADPAGRWVLRVEGVRASASLWADVSKPVHAAALGDGVAAASFKDGKVAVRRRDGASFVVQGLDRVEARRLPGGI